MRRVLALLSLALTTLAAPVLAQTYPTKPVRLIVSFGPGGSADTTARLVAERLTAALGQPVVVENRAGALTVIAADLVAQSAPDGYTLFLMPGTHVLSPKLVKGVTFDPIKDFTAISMIAYAPLVFFSDPKRPYSTMKGLISYAGANPGKVSIGTTDAYGQLAIASLRAAMKVDLGQVGYKNANSLSAEVTGGHVDLGALTPPSVHSLWQAKRVNVLAATGHSRIASMPEVPTVAESLGMPDFDFQTWFALSGPAGIPAPIVDRLQAEMKKILADRETLAKLEMVGLVPAVDVHGERLVGLLKRDSDRYGKMLDQVGIKPE
ncbi:MAG: Bug family tripartite tricarboxylate transporter substrate binding protein [Lautropia sp.]